MPRKGTVLSPEAAARQRAAQKAWLAENTTKVTFSWRKEKVELYKALAQARGSSLSGLIQELLDRECKRDGLKTEQGPGR